MKPIPPRPLGARPLAGFGSRTAAYLIDLLVMAGVLWLLNLLGFVLVKGPTLGIAFSILFVAWYQIAKIGGSQGQTWGMRYLEIVCVDAKTGKRPIGYARAFARAICWAVMAPIPVIGLLDLLWASWDPGNQTLHDKVAGTIVLRRT